MILLPLFLALVVIAVVWYGTAKLLTLPRWSERPAPTACGLPFEDVSFKASDGVVLRGWWFPKPGQPVIIYGPGRGRGLNEFDFRYARLFHDADRGGYQVLMFDWRGMGASGGRSSMGFWEQLDLHAAVAWVRRRHAGRIGAIGASLGAAVILLAAGDLPDLDAVAGDCSFATFQGMIASGSALVYSVPLPLARPLAWAIARAAGMRLRFGPGQADPLRAVGRISPRPVFIMHGRYDRHIPPAAAHQLYAAAGEPKALWVYEAAHTEGLEKQNPEYRQRILSFFDCWLKPEG